MPDNSNKYQNPAFIDRGWNKMAAILDKEMPAGRARNRKFFWIFLAAFLFLSISGISLYTFSNIGQTQSKTAKGPITSVTPDIGKSGTANTLIEDDQEQQDQFSDKTESADISSGTVRSETKDLPVKTGFSRDKTALSSGQIDLAMSDNSGIERRRPQATQTTHDITQAKNHESSPKPGLLAGEIRHQSPSQDVKTEDKDVKNMQEQSFARVYPESTTQQNQKSIVQDNQEINTLEDQVLITQDEVVSPTLSLDLRSDIALVPLPLLNKVLTAEMINLVRPVYVKTPKVKRRSKMSVLAISAIHFGEILKGTGIDAGLGLSYKLANKWSISSGIQYGHFDRNGVLGFSGVKNFDALQQDVETTVGSGGLSNVIFAEEIVNNTVSYDTILDLTDKLNYLHVPLQVHYKLSPRLSLSGGARMSFLLDAPSEYGISSDQPNFSNQVQYFSRASQDQNNFLDDYNLLRKFDIAPTFGLQYHMSSRLLATASYYHGIIPYINRTEIDSRNDFNRTWSLGLAYRIY